MNRILAPLISFAAVTVSSAALCAAPANYSLSSPDGRLRVDISTSDGIRYSVSHDDVLLLENSRASMTLEDGTVYGGPGSKVRKSGTRSCDVTVPSPFYKKSEVRDNFNELSLEYKDCKVLFRAYDEACSYRFVPLSDKPFIVKDEQADFRFPEDWTAYVPYVNKKWKGSLQDILINDFQCTYTHTRLSEWIDRWSIVPILIECPRGKKVVITEAGLTDYPGMFLYNYRRDGETTLSGYYARVPAKTEIGGHNRVQELVTERCDCIAYCGAGAELPWRVIVVSSSDRELADSDVVWKLSAPAEDTDWSWVRPGKVAWDWWNAWNIRGVDFEAGINNDTYRYYIDFAASKGIEYVILDEGWAVKYANDLFQVVPEIDLEELVAYADAKGVGIILWAGYWPLAKDMENVCRHFSEMGVKGFKVDFMNRDDQKMVDWFGKAAAMCAKYHLMINFHGAYKPTGLQRTYPNVVNFEGVFGLEQMKWSDPSVDQMIYDVTIPYIRMLAGPMDYTPGAMRNATKKNYFPVRTEPMSQGTRCHQLAEYVVFEAPLNMMCDSPSNYMAEEECTDFIVSVPTVWDETVALDGKVAEYVAIARRKGDRWFIGAMSNWDPRDIELDLGFLPEGDYEMTVYQDGVNAHRAASDYRKSVVPVPASRKVAVKMAPGGGWAARIVKKTTER
jgi:alpha-glucosidase